ncbi:HesB/IscA family protein [Gluconobacter kondonii]|uniref:HesB/IscA family protein n=1 Tax=Gluconobacter kondonii TaxID=941463 RepID=UPI002231DE6A|nr:iron-sulfur cluster assembly accessory protein [Gluconobacter kondonii]
MVVLCDDVKVFVDRQSSPHLEGTTVDFVVSLEQSGFSFDNPNAASKCSCGKSFN